jgi:hypothetical protein
VRILARLERIVAAMGQSGASEPRKAPSRRRKAPVVVG